MAIEQIPLGQAPYGEDGADAREAFTTVNQNFAELDARSAQNAEDIAGKADSNDARFTDAREWIAATISQAEAEAGSATTRRAWTAVRVWQAIAAWWAASAAKSKLDGIAAGATANSSDATLLNRANHTGTQLLSTISNAGTAAAANTTTSDTDATSGRVLTVGAFGLGAFSVPSLTDVSLDTIPTGLYAVTAATVGIPVAQAGFIDIRRAGSQLVLQRYTSRTSGVDYFRSKSGTSWSPWYNQWHSGNLEKTATAADTGAGKVTRAGDFGLGAAGLDMLLLPSPTLGFSNFTFFYTINPNMTDRPCEYGAGMHIKYGDQLYGFDFAGDVQTETFFVRKVGATGTGTWRKIFHEGNLQPIKLLSYTFATLPAASGNNGLMVMCSNLAGGNAPVFSNGTSWLKAADNTAAAAA